jgi:hypothetical protein
MTVLARAVDATFAAFGVDAAYTPEVTSRFRCRHSLSAGQDRRLRRDPYPAPTLLPTGPWSNALMICGPSCKPGCRIEPLVRVVLVTPAVGESLPKPGAGDLATSDLAVSATSYVAPAIVSAGAFGYPWNAYVGRSGIALGLLEDVP